MDTKAPLWVMLALGVGVAMYQASGAGALLDAGPGDDLEAGDQFNASAEDHNVESGELEGDVNPQSDNIIGLILGSIPKFFGLLAIPGMLSAELMTLGLWSFAAIPLGLLANLVVWVGAFQVATGRIYE